jgi:hypothetical protein
VVVAVQMEQKPPARHMEPTPAPFGHTKALANRACPRPLHTGPTLRVSSGQLQASSSRVRVPMVRKSGPGPGFRRTGLMGAWASHALKSEGVFHRGIGLWSF